MSRGILLFLVCLSLSITSKVCAQETYIQLDNYLSSAIDYKNNPGIVAMASDKNGLFYSSAFGMADIATEREITQDTLIRIASMSKPITTVAAMQLVERGIIELDVPVENYLPEFSRLQVLDGFNDEGRPILRKPTSEVTLRQLLSHTAGFVYTFSNEKALRLSGIEDSGIDIAKGTDLINVPLGYDPGTIWEYGVGVDWAGILIERMTNQTLEDYFFEHIFSPLNMTNTRFDLNPTQIDSLATLYIKDKGGKVSALGPWQNDPFQSGGSGLVSTANEYMRFLRMLLNGGEYEGKRILKAETIDLMEQNNIGTLNVRPVLHSYMQDRSRDIKFFEHSNAKFGLGFLINEDEINNARAAASLTWGGLYNTFFWIDPKNEICAVFITQILPFFDPETIDVYKNFEKLIYQSHKIKGK